MLTPVTPLGQLVFFARFLATSGRFDRWVEDLSVGLHQCQRPSGARGLRDRAPGADALTVCAEPKVI